MCVIRSTIDVLKIASNVCNLLPLERSSVLMANQTRGLIKTYYGKIKDFCELVIRCQIVPIAYDFTKR